jgi:hypothetical protein
MCVANADIEFATGQPPAQQRQPAAPPQRPVGAHAGAPWHMERTPTYKQRIANACCTGPKAGNDILSRVFS